MGKLEHASTHEHSAGTDDSPSRRGTGTRLSPSLFQFKDAVRCRNFGRRPVFLRTDPAATQARER
jgi:hypothetical protein